MMSSSEPTTDAPFSPISTQYTKLQRQYQQLLDKITPFVLYRWLGMFGLVVVFMLRIIISQGVSFVFVVLY